MRSILQKLLLFVVTMGCLPAMAASSSTTLNYQSPSQKWMGSLPLGNGRIGAMVYGGTARETVALNEVTMWSGQYDAQANDLCGPERLKEIRDVIFSGDVVKGNNMTWQYLNGHGKSFGTHLPVGDLVVKFDGRDGEAKNYNRQLSLDRAVATVTYNINGVGYTNEYFTSNPAQVLAARFSASKKQSVSATIGLSMLRHSTVKAQGNELIVEGDARFDKNGDGGVKFCGVVRIIADGGQLTPQGSEIKVEGANSVVVLFDLRTDFQNPGYENQAAETVGTAASMGYDKLKAAHEADFGRIFNRMSIDLGGQTTGKSTDELFNDAHAGNPSAEFDALFFQYGRYMLISSSRENSPLPANLQGIWNDNLACNMPWTCDYHLDINIQQNYWSANIANMAECNVPLFRYLGLLAKYGHDTARKVYGCDGWVAHTINNVWGDTAPAAVSWGLNVTAGAWQATHLWTHYLYTQDKDYLRETGYPLLKETAKFFIDYMVKDPNLGYLVTGPSISPENAFRSQSGHGINASMMPTIDRAVVYEIYNACIESAKILGIDDDFRARLERDIKQLPPYTVRKNGELAEWLYDWDREDASHRHASHLLGLYPFGHISPVRTPGLAKACDVFLDHQTSHKNWEDTEWTRGNNINFYARLKNADKAYESIRGLYTHFMRENLMTVSPAGVAGAEEDIFSFDATEAAVSGACEMLLQSYDGILEFLPALPQAWKQQGSIRGVCAMGGIEADFSWKNGEVTTATLRSKSDQTVRVKINGKTTSVNLKAGKSQKIL